MTQYLWCRIKDNDLVRVQKSFTVLHAIKPLKHKIKMHKKENTKDGGVYVQNCVLMKASIQ